VVSLPPCLSECVLRCDAYMCTTFSCADADVAALQQPDGSFFGDEWGEVDTRCVAFAGLISIHSSIHPSIHPCIYVHSILFRAYQGQTLPKDRGGLR
jgi:hypothetical protein